MSTSRQVRNLRDLRIPVTFLRATALELAILAGHLLLYPSGLTPERTPAPRPSAHDRATDPGDPGGPGDPPDRDLGALPDPPDATALVTGPGPDHPPVVMLHGFVDNRSVFVLLRRSLARHGWRHLECLNYSPLTCDIRVAAELLGRHIEEICARTGRSQVDIVGHSLGGLIARYYIQRLGGDRRVRTLVTLGTPHAGTTVAALASAHPIVRQMRPGSSVIEELGAAAPGCRTRCVSFWSDLDQLMVPIETARLDHPDLITENVRVSGIGHLALPVHPAVAARIREALETKAPSVDASGAVSVA
ncbi:esterase/lipase family protein [Streptomyces sp. NPDC055078]